MTASATSAAALEDDGIFFSKSFLNRSTTTTATMAHRCLSAVPAIREEILEQSRLRFWWRFWWYERTTAASQHHKKLLREGGIYHRFGWRGVPRASAQRWNPFAYLIILFSLRK